MKPLLERTITVPAASGEALHGDLRVPNDASGLVVFAHGSGSSRHSPRNRMVADHLCRRGLATLLVDLLTVEEDRAEQAGALLRFDVDLLAARLYAASSWTRTQSDLEGLALGYFGASTGAAAALVAAAGDPDHVAAVVSRGGRPDLAAERLRAVQAPTLLIVGGNDGVVVDLNKEALAKLSAPSRLEIIPGATHLFEEPGALEAVAGCAGDWLTRHLAGAETGNAR